MEQTGPTPRGANPAERQSGDGDMDATLIEEDGSRHRILEDS